MHMSSLLWSCGLLNWALGLGWPPPACLLWASLLFPCFISSCLSLFGMLDFRGRCQLWEILFIFQKLRVAHFHQPGLGWLKPSWFSCSHWVQAICAFSERMLSSGGCARLSQSQQAGGLLSAPERWGDKSSVCSSIFLFTLWMFWGPIWSVTYSAGWAGGGPAGVSFWLMSLMSRVRHLQWKVHRLTVRHV